jgi:hypothetical protein
MFWGSPENSLEAMDAPCMPSRPVADPMIITEFPAPVAIADAVASVFTIPTAMAFTRGLSV